VIIKKKWCDDLCLCRYLRARQYNLDKAEVMLRNTLTWRKEHHIDDIRAIHVEDQLRYGHMYNSGYGIRGHPVIILRTHTKEDPHTQEEKLKFMIYNMERAIRVMDKTRHIEKMVWLVSCKNYSWKHNGQMGFAQALLKVLQDHYPERLLMLIICDAPYIFRMFWALIYPFVDASTAKKILFLIGSDSDKRKLIENIIDLNEVEPLFGGYSKKVFNGEEHMKMLNDEEASLVPIYTGTPKPLI